MIRNVLELLERTSIEFSGKTAVIEGERSITYKKLTEQAMQIGSALSVHDVFGKPVGVFMEKGIDALCTFFGIVYAGGAYSMLSTELNDNRLRQIQSVLMAETIVTTDELRPKAQELFPDAEVLVFGDISSAMINMTVLEKARTRAVDTDPLYINFTSGSTGVPKGIAVAHRSVIEFIGYFTELFGITSDDIIANQAPFDFDVSVKDIYSAISTGAALVIVPRKLFSAPVKLLDYLCDNKVTAMIWAVSALCLITTFHGLDYKVPETVNKIMFSGEVMPIKHLKQWQEKLPDAMYVNLYGPTEITCNCTYHILEKDRDYTDGIPAGVSFPNEDVFLLSETNERITDIGIVGGIAVRGTALALGYYNMPERTAESFVQNPLNRAYPELIYLTGDLGMYNEKGELMFCGRSDNQIKYMGHRIELEEIEKAMGSIDGVERCFCIFDKAKERLKAFYTGSIEKPELTAKMKELVPFYMIPGFIRRLDEMPLTKNGKIDRKKAVEMIGG